MALRAVYLDAIGLGVTRGDRGCDKVLDHLGHLSRRQRVRHSSASRAGDFRGSDQSSDAATQMLSSALIELHDEERALLVDGVADSAKSGDYTGIK